MYSSQGRRGGPPKSTPSDILCQNILLTQHERHYSYECKVAPQDRPYRSRPSRSQQLRNPKLAPKLHEETFNALQSKEGVADQELVKREAERAKRQKREESDSEKDGYERKNLPKQGLEIKRARRRRSVSNSASDSDSKSVASSISTRSGGRPPFPGTAASELKSQTTFHWRDRSASPAAPHSSSPYSSADDNHRTKMTASTEQQRRKDGPRASLGRRLSPQCGHSSKPRDDHPRMKSTDFFEHGPGTDPDKGGQTENWKRDREGESRFRGGRPSVAQRDGDTQQRYRQRDDRYAGDDHGVSQQDNRRRSLSPFSRRLALTQAMNSER